MILSVSIVMAFVVGQSGKPVLAMISAEDEYQTETTLPKFAKAHLPVWTATLITADPNNKHHLPNLQPIEKADVILLSIRRRPLVEADLKAIKSAISARKPIVAIRTTSHAFAPKKDEKLPDGVVAWEEFDRDILGCHYTGHYPNTLKTTVTRPVAANDHPILKGIASDPFISPCWLYKSNPLKADCVPLLVGTVGENPPEPAAWVRERTRQRGRVFYTCLGTPGDFELKQFTTMLAQAVEWVRK